MWRLLKLQCHRWEQVTSVENLHLYKAIPKQKHKWAFTFSLPPAHGHLNGVHQIRLETEMLSVKQHLVSTPLREPAQLLPLKAGASTWLTFRKPSNTSFIFSYLLKRSASDFSTEFRSARACSFSTISCWTVWWETDFSLCSSSVRKKRAGGRKAIFRRVGVVRTLISPPSIVSTILCLMLHISKFVGSRKVIFI